MNFHIQTVLCRHTDVIHLKRFINENVHLRKTTGKTGVSWATPCCWETVNKHWSCDQIFRRKAAFHGVCKGKNHMGKVVRHLFPKKTLFTLESEFSHKFHENCVYTKIDHSKFVLYINCGIYELQHVGTNKVSSSEVSRDTAQLTPFLCSTYSVSCATRPLFFGHAILLKQLCLHSFCLFEGMHNILKYLQIY